MTNEFHSFSTVGWIASAYLLTSTSFQPLFSRMYASFNAKWVITVAFAIFELGSLICGVATSIEMFIVGRAIAGIGLAGGYVGALTIAAMIAPPRIRPMIMSAVGAAYGFGAILGPIIGGAFTSTTTWRWAFYINLCFMPLVFGSILLFLRVKTPVTTLTIVQRLLSVDYVGTGLLLAAVICILLVFQWGGVEYAWNSSHIIGLIIGFALISLVFVGWMLYLGEKAIIAPRILRNRTVGFASLVNFCVASSYFTVLYSLPLYFQAVEGSSAIRSGVETLPFIMAVIFALIVSSSFISKSGIYIPWLVGGTALGTLGAGLLIMLKPDSSQAFWAGIGFLAGLGPGMAWMIPFSAATAVLSSEDLALGTGAVALFQVLGGTITVSLAQSIYVNKFQQALFSIPNVDPAAVLSQGITSFRETVSAEALPAVIDAANSAISKTFIVATVFGGLGLLAVFGMDLNARIPVAQEGTEKPIIAAA